MNSAAPRRKLLIWGAGGHALVVADAVRLAGQYCIAGYIDDVNPHRRGTTHAGGPVFGGQEELDALRALGIQHMIIAFGDCAARLQRARLAVDKGFHLATAIHPHAIVASDVTIGPGTAVMAGCVINSQARIGDNAIVNTCSSIDHECCLEDGVHIAPGVILGGRVSVGRGAWIGIGATVKEGIRIGARSLVGAGAVVLRDLPENVVAYGVPARIVRSRSIDE